MLRAERAALFWYDIQKDAEKNDHYILYNITPSETKSPGFKLSKDLIRESLKAKAPCIRIINQKSDKKNPFSIRSMFCLSGTINKQLSWALYLDNHFLEDQYHKADPILIAKLIKQSTPRTEKVLGYERIKPKIHSQDLKESIQTIRSDDEMQFQNPMMVELISEVDRVAQTDSSVLIYGETGTGKEVLAQRIHHLSPRNKNPFVVVDLASIPENLLESELFGYEKGAFTGATERKRGRLELVHKGTLFLDEIGEIPLSFQVKLLRLLQEKKFIRIGGAQTIHVDFRLITATNRNLEEEVAAGRFRQDLYYRLSVVPVRLPPLRERQGDILLIAKHFISIFSKKHNRPYIHMTAEDESWLMFYTWPGNIRELRNVMERSIILSSNGMLNLNMINNTPATPVYNRAMATEHLPFKTSSLLFSENDMPAFDEIQRRYIQMVLNKVNGKISGNGGAAEILKMKYSTLYAKMKKLGLR
jgi:transcriptional regulator with GAF, ATPase, and Fis domain